MTRTLYYVDPISDGHHGEHFKFYASLAASMNLEVAAFVPVETWNFLSADERSGARRYDPVDFKRVTLFSGVRQIKVISDLVGRSGEAAVFFPLIDDYVPALAALATVGWKIPFAWGGVFFRDSFNFVRDENGRIGASARSAVKLRLLRAAMKNNGRGLLTLDPYWSVPIGAPVHWLPDAMSELDAALPGAAPKARAGDDEILFAMFGALAPRKGLLEFLRAMSLLADDELSRVRLKVAGKFAADGKYKASILDCADSLRRRGGKIEILDMFIANDDLKALIVEADIVLVSYINHLGSSGALGLAVRHGRPVIAQNTYQIGREVAEHDLGLVVDPSDARTVADAIRKCLEDPLMPTDPGGRFRQTRRFEHARAVAEDFLSSLYEAEPRAATVPAGATC